MRAVKPVPVREMVAPATKEPLFGLIEARLSGARGSGPPPLPLVLPLEPEVETPSPVDVSGSELFVLIWQPVARMAVSTNS